MNCRRTPGLNESAEEIFRRHPLGCPLSLLTTGLAILVLVIAVAEIPGRTVVPGLVLAAAVVLLLLGIGILPFGVATAVRRKRAVILRCPRCDAESRQLGSPFSVQRWDDVPYAYIVCPQCGKDFTVDKWVKLV